MVNKQGLIFLTLTSLILVLSIYYITMPNELLLTTNSSYLNNENQIIKNSDEIDKDTLKVTVNESNITDVMRSILNDERMNELKILNEKLIQKDLGTDERNNVYEEIKSINKIKTMEEDIERKIKESFNLDSFVKINNDVIEVIINSNKHDANLVVKIMNLIEKDYQNMYISVSFKS